MIISYFLVFAESARLSDKVLLITTKLHKTANSEMPCGKVRFQVCF